MLSEIIHPGDKFDIEILKKIEKNAKKTTYSSQIYDIIDKDKIVAMLPIYRGLIVPLPINAKYELVIYANTALYKCNAILKERYKEDNMHVMILEICSELKKYQRREYYRLTYSLDLTYYVLGDDLDIALDKMDEILEILPVEELQDTDETEVTVDKHIVSEVKSSENHGSVQGITIDISGGGMRFVSKKRTDIGQYILLEFAVMVDGKKVEYSQLSKVIYTREVPTKANTYEHRVQFERITIPERELLIKFIFEQERRYRNIEKS